MKKATIIAVQLPTVTKYQTFAVSYWWSTGRQ